MSAELPALFECELTAWYEQNKRTLPWRETADPYRIWISEIILQQTRVAQGLDYYHRFMVRFPQLADLAAASEEEVLRLWQGLGYYSRARNLHAAAKDVVARFDGKFPATYNEVRSLKGVGDYTAAAIVSFAQNLPYAVVDGNVYRVLSRLFAMDDPIDSTQGKRRFAELAQQLLPKSKAGLYNQALMEFGALQCVPGEPDCAVCPLQKHCVAFSKKTVGDYPVKEKKTKRRDRYFTYIYVRWDERVYIRRRGGDDIWKGLFEFPLIEADRLLEPAELPEQIAGAGIVCSVTDMPKHVLSHQTLYARMIEVEATAPLQLGDCMVIKHSELDNYAFPRLILKYLDRILK